MAPAGEVQRWTYEKMGIWSEKYKDGKKDGYMGGNYIDRHMKDGNINGKA